MILALFVAASVCVGVVRTLVRHADAPVARSRRWRLAVLLALQPLCGGLLYLTLAPPPSSSPAGTLVVATRNAPVIKALASEEVIALPEAPAIPGAERVPDLATALRRHPAARLRIIGEGLEPRDRDAVKGLTLDLDLTPIPPGLTRLNAPQTVGTGAAFRVGGRVNILKSKIELIDPANRRVDTAVPDAAGDFVVEGTSRAAGPAVFTLRILDGQKVVEEAAVPISTTTAVPQRILLLPGAPGPEIKYLRRWASDAGLAVQNQYAVGGGLEIGDTPLPLTAATLKRFDVAVLDDRSWTALSPGERTVFSDAVRDGLGLIVRITGPLTDAARSALRPLGFAVSGGTDVVPVTLPSPANDAAAQQARSGPGTSDAPATLNRADAEPALSLWNARIDAPAATPLLRDVHGATVAIWRAEGQGRIAIWPLADSFRLVLAGRGDRYGELWSAAFATLGRNQPGSVPEVEGARVGQRVALCGVGGTDLVISPDGGTAKLLVDSRAGATACAPYWPNTTGWHRLEQHDVHGKVTSWPFYVAPTDATPGVRAVATHDATQRLAGSPAAATRATAADATRPGSSWPWFLLWLAASALLWWFERARLGRANTA